MFSPTSILITGGAGFIGANLVHYLLSSNETARVVNLDALTYAGNPANLTGLDEAHGDRYRFVEGSICDGPLVKQLVGDNEIDTVIHLAAESHVDRSIDGPAVFIETNVRGTFTLLEAAREAWGDRRDVRFHHVSTDEVYGSLGETGLFTEETPYDPSSPYSASKAASDHLVRAWARTYEIPVTISNCSNNYGPYQFPEKLLPLMILKALDHEPLPVYGDGSNVRDWLYVEDHCRAIDTIVRGGTPGRTYNVGGCNEWTNIDIVRLLCDTLEELRPISGENEKCSLMNDRESSQQPATDNQQLTKPIKSYRDLITFVPDRPGHDKRYAIDSTRIQHELGWTPAETFETGLRKTMQWYLDHPDWTDNILSGGYRAGRLGLSTK